MCVFLSDPGKTGIKQLWSVIYRINKAWYQTVRSNTELRPFFCFFFILSEPDAYQLDFYQCWALCHLYTVYCMFLHFAFLSQHLSPAFCSSIWQQLILSGLLNLIRLYNIYNSGFNIGNYSETLFRFFHFFWLKIQTLHISNFCVGEKQRPAVWRCNAVG